MSIAFLCPRCQAPLTVSDGDAGRKLRCPSCRGKLRVPLPPAVTSGRAIEFLCPRCRQALTVPAETAGQKQRCRHCRGKLRVPAPQSLAAGEIEFRCPRCHAVMQAAVENAGSKQICPACHAKVRVPATILSNGDCPQFVPGQKGPGRSPAQVAEGGNSAETGWTPEEEGEEPEGIPSLMTARRSSLAGLLLPLAGVAVLAAIAAVLLHQPAPRLEGTLTGERLTDIEFGPFRVPNEYLGAAKRSARDVISNLQSQPIRAVSPMLMLEFQGSPGGINVLIRCGDAAAFYRVDPRQDRNLAKYLDQENDRLTAARNRELTESLPAFVSALAKRTEDQRDVAGLAEFRNSVGLNSIVRSFGREVQAGTGRQAYPCVYEDAEGCLYFALPVDTSEFEITGRARSPRSSPDDPQFPGRYRVVVSKEPVTVKNETSDSKQKIRKLLRE